MTARRGEALYTPELLALAVSLADYPLDETLTLGGEARSRSCGSTVIFTANLEGEDRIGAVGLRVSACAVGQAAAAIFAAHARGRSAEEIEAALEEIERWLAGDGGLPTWPGIAKLDAARAYPGRHGAILLSWNAASAALCKAGADG